MNQRFVMPRKLSQSCTETHGDQGIDWLRRLPGIVSDCAERWALTLGAPFADVALNYVAPGMRADGTKIVLKVCYPSHEFVTEAQALELFAGYGAVRLFAVDHDRCALLLERLLPGTSLAMVNDDERATYVAASVMRRLWRPAPAGHPFPSFADWVTHMAERAPRLDPARQPFSHDVDHACARYIRRAWRDRRRSGFCCMGICITAISSQGEREPWVAIDPKGVMGEPICETGPLLLNALPADHEEASDPAGPRAADGPVGRRAGRRPRQPVRMGCGARRDVRLLEPGGPRPLVGARPARGRGVGQAVLTARPCRRIRSRLAGFPRRNWCFHGNPENRV